MKSLAGQRFLITGASGFIGQRLCVSLRKHGAEIVALVRRRIEGPWDQSLTVNLGHEEIPLGAFEGIDAIFHLAGKAHVAARTPSEIAEYHRVHVDGTRALVNAALQAEVRRFVFMSSIKAMGEGGDIAEDENSFCDPQTPYGKSKLEAERIVFASGLHCPVVLRPALVYGPGSKGNLAIMARAVKKGVFPSVAFPENARSMVHVEDVVQACMLAVAHPAACNQCYILTDGGNYSMRQIFLLMASALNRKNRFALPFWPLQVCAKFGSVLDKIGIPFPLKESQLSKLTGSARYSNSKICRELGFVPQYDLKTGIAQMVAEMRGATCY